MFASQKTDDVTFDEGIVTVRKLSGASLDKAEEARNITTARMLRALGPVQVQDHVAPAQSDKSTEPKKPTPPADRKEQIARSKATYDRITVIRAGIVRWTLPQQLEHSIDDLDEDTCEKLYYAIMDLSLPPLDQKAEEVKS